MWVSAGLVGVGCGGDVVGSGGAGLGCDGVGLVGFGVASGGSGGEWRVGATCNLDSSNWPMTGPFVPWDDRSREHHRFPTLAQVVWDTLTMILILYSTVTVPVLLAFDVSDDSLLFAVIE